MLAWGLCHDLMQLPADVSRLSQHEIARSAHRRNTGFQRDKPANNGDNPLKSCCESRVLRVVLLETSFVIGSSKSALLIAAVAGSVVLTASRSHAQWWSTRTPVDYEECADLAEKAATKEARTSELAGCNAKFAGRRKPGGGYTYYDFMQNRSFDIAGPNPTAGEQKYIDEQYTTFLDHQRRTFVAAALTAKQEQQASLQTQPSPPRNEPAPPRNERAPVQTEAPSKPKASAADLKTRAKANCIKHSTFSCEWPVLSEKITNLKKALFGPPQAQAQTQTKSKRGVSSSRGDASASVQSAAR
jgi:hypothetical protein